MPHTSRLLVTCFALAVSVLSAKVPAQFWGDYQSLWQEALADLVTPTVINDKTPAIPVHPQTRLAVWAHLCGYRGKVLDQQDIRRVFDYVQQGGVLILYCAVPAKVFPEKGFDLSAAAPVLGASRYCYNSQPSKLTALGRQVLGELAQPGDIYTSHKGTRPSLGELCGMKVLFGSDTQADLGVNRIGRGAVIYSTGAYKWGFQSKQEKPYARMLHRLVQTVLDPQQLDRFFPITPGNDAVAVNGTKLNLTIEGKGRAAKFLREKLQAITGKDLNHSYTSEQFIIHVGQTPYAKSLNLDLKSLHPYGYVMVCRDGRNLVLTGRNTKAENYAVNDFLKRYAGYRNFGNTPIMEVIPSRPCLALPATLNVREEPDVNSYVVAWSNNSGFARNNRLNSMATHALADMVPPKRFAKTHPEYFPMIGGKRVQLDENDRKNGPWNPCMSNPDLPRLVAEYADRYFQKNPDCLSLPLGVNDGGGDCQCPKCQELLRKSGNLYAEFYNMAARIVAKNHPGKLVAFIAYSRAASTPPRGITMEPNILVETIGIRAHGQNKLAQWKDIGVKNFGLYQYLYTTGGRRFVPQFYPHLLGNLWKELHRDYHLQSMWLEYYPRTELLDAPRQIVLDELAWNMDADIDAILEDYYQTMFLKAAPEIKQVFAILETCFARTVDLSIDHGYFGPRFEERGFTREDLKKLETHLNRALTLENSPKVRQRLTLMNHLLQLISYHAINRICTEELKQMTAFTSLEDCRRAVAIAAEAYDAQNRLAAYTIAPQEEKLIFIQDDTKSFTSPTINPRPILEAVLDPAFKRLTTFLKNHDHDLDSFYQEQAKNHKLPELRDALLTQLYLERQPIRNLVRNPSFEDQGTNNAKKRFSDHENLRGVPHWSTWTFPSSVTRFSITDQQAHSGKYAGIIRENQQNGTLISYVGLKPKCRYRFSLWVKRNRGNVAFRGCGGASIRLQCHGSFVDGGGVTRIAFTPECENKWTPYDITFTAPDKKDLVALILLGAPRQTPDIWTAYDDVALELIYDPDVNLTPKQP